MFLKYDIILHVKNKYQVRRVTGNAGKIGIIRKLFFYYVDLFLCKERVKKI